MDDESGFGQVAIKHAAEFEDPDKPQEVQRFAEPKQLAGCIALLLSTARDHEHLSDLSSRLQESAGVLADDNFRIDEARRAVKEIAECFENYLQLIAILKYPGRNDLLFGTDAHRGLMHTSLGGLLHGQPEPQSQEVTRPEEVPTVRLVTYNAQSNGRRDRVYRAVKRIRNKVHSAQATPPYQVLHDSRLVLAAYLFATEENAKLIASKLYPHRNYLADLLNRLRPALPLVVEPELESQLTEKEGSEDNASLSDRTSFDQFAEAARDNRAQLRFAIYGDPGAGKTTFVYELTRRLAEIKRRLPLGDDPLPVLIEANRYTGEESFKELVAAELDITVERLNKVSTDTPLVILIDGLNEVPAQARNRARSELRNLSTQWRRVGIVLTSRFPRVFQLLGFRKFRLAPFDNRRVREFVAESLESDRAQKFENELRRLPRLLELCRNPLLLRMLVELSSGGVKIPKNRGKLLDGFMTRFLEREEPQITPVSAPTMRLLLSRLAFEMRSRKVVALPSTEVEQLFHIMTRELQRGVGAVDVLSAVLGAKLLHFVGDARVAFFHELIQEYFAALELLGRLRSDELDVGSLTLDEWWHEVVVLAYGLAEDDRYLFDSMAANDLTLLARAVMDAPDPNKERQAQVVERAATVIEGGRVGQGRALEALAIVWNEEALRRAAMALRSRSQVTDFVERFSRDPFEAALDLLEESPTGAVVAGVGVALRRTSRVGSQKQLRKLFGRAVELIGLKADGHAGELSYEPLAQIALLGSAPPEKGMLRDGITALIEVQQAQWAYRLAIQYASCHQDVDTILSRRLVTELILQGTPHGSCLDAGILPLTQNEWRSLQWLALVNEAYDWVVGLARYIDDPVDVPEVLVRQYAHRVVRVSNGRRLGKILQGIAGWAMASSILRSMVSALQIPPSEVGNLTRWLGDSSLIRSCMTEYFRLAVRQRRGPECYSEIAHWAEPGDLDSDVGEGLLDFLVHEEEWETVLLVLHAMDRKKQHAQLIGEAQRALDPSSPRVPSRYWGDLVFRKFWSDWSERFRSRLLNHAEMHPEDMVVEEWSLEALEGLRSLLRSRLESLECVVDRAACKLAGIEEEASQMVSNGIVGAIRRGNEELAIDIAIAWGLAAGDLNLSSAQHAVMQRIVQSRVLRLFETGDVQHGFVVCEAWGIEPREALPSVASLFSGDTPARVVLAGSNEGIFGISEVETWFLARIRKGEVGQALSLRQSSSLRQSLHGAAALAALELFETDRYKEAGQVIAAFQLQDDFRTELENIVPHLVAEGKPGIAEQLVQSLGPQYSRAFADLILETAKSRLEQGKITTLLRLINTTGMSFLHDEFKPVLARYVEDALQAGKLAEVGGIMKHPVLASMIDSPQLVQVLERSKAKVLGTVTNMKDDSYAFVALSIAGLSIFVHRSALTGVKMSQLKIGSRLVVAIKATPKGPAATWARVTSDGSDTVTEPEALPTDENRRSLAKLRDAWGARLRDAGSDTH